VKWFIAGTAPIALYSLTFHLIIPTAWPLILFGLWLSLCLAAWLIDRHRAF
jgi:hypothetical protein